MCAFFNLVYPSLNRPIFRGRYLTFVIQTWLNVAWCFFSNTLGWIDFVAIVFIAVSTTSVLFLLLLWCLGATIPYYHNKFRQWSARNALNLSIVNALFPDMFRQLTEEQAVAAKRALSAPVVASQNNQQQRLFDLDIAKMLLQVASLMYERPADPLLKACRSTYARLLPGNTTIAPPGTPITPKPPPGSSRGGGGGSDDDDEWMDHIGKLLEEAVGKDAAAEIGKGLKENKADGAIEAFVQQFGIEYAPVSELNAVSSAYSALFWDPASNWIIVAFKGTSPTEFEEWVTDFSYGMVEAGDFLNGFSKVHAGFMERIFPSDVSESNGRKPYDTIANAVKLVANYLRPNLAEGTEINVWFTGHSLGCAMGSLAYARAMCNELDFGGAHVRVRDAYLFAAPVVCDAASVRAFNNAANRDLAHPHTMWRITNGEDAVATALPELGDRRAGMLSDNPFAYAHLGAEIKMRSKPDPCFVTSSKHIVTGTYVAIHSSFPQDQIGERGVNQGLDERVQKLQKIPVIGRLIQHGTSFYWDQLDRIGAGYCIWTDN